MKQKNFTSTAFACILTGLLTSVSALRIGQNYLNIGRFVPRPVQSTIVGLYLLVLIIYLFTRARKASRDDGKSAMQLAFWQGSLRYVIALDLCVFGIGKFFNIQFHTPLAWYDSPYRTLSPDQLMWAFFGYFYAFPRIIGALQITGSVLLLFRRTWLTGVMILLPVLLNILLLDSFYLPGTLYYAVIEAAGVVYLLLSEYPRLAQFFFVDKSNLPQYAFKSTAWKNTLRACAVLIPFTLMLIRSYPQYYAEINGEYLVQKLTVNDSLQNINVRTDSVLTKVFIDKDDLVLEYNDYRRRIIGSYKYDRKTKKIIGIWRYPRNQHDTLFAEILFDRNPNKKMLNGHMGKQVFKIEMEKIPNRDN